MSSEKITPEFRRLVEQAMDGVATAEEWSELQCHLLASQDARDFYLNYVNLHSALQRRFLSDEDSIEEPEPSRADLAQAADASRSTSAVPVWLASVIALAIVLIVAWRSPSLWPDRAMPTIRFVEGEVAVVSEKETRAAQVGDLLRQGESLRVEGESARAELQYADGTQVQVHSESVVQAPTGQDVSLELLAGSMEVDAPKQSSSGPLVFATQHSKYSASGRFRLYREPAASRLELDNGAAKLDRSPRGETMLVEAGTVAVIAGDETPVKVSPLASGRAELLRSTPRGGDRVAFSRDGKSLFANLFDSALREYRVDDLQVLHEYRKNPDRSHGLVALNEKGLVAHIYRNGQMLVWNPQKDDAFSLAIGGEQVRSRAISPDGLYVVESSPEGIRAFALDLKEKRLKSVFFATFPGKAWCLALSKDGERLAAGFWDGTVRVYELATSRVVFERKLQHTPTLLDMTEDGTRIAVFTQRDGLLCIDLPSGEQHLIFSPGLAQARSMQLTPDGKRVIAGMNDQTARMWEVDSGQALLVIEAGHSPQGVAWREEGQILATADGGLKLWKCTFDKPGKVAE